MFMRVFFRAYARKKNLVFFWCFLGVFLFFLGFFLFFARSANFFLGLFFALRQAKPGIPALYFAERGRARVLQWVLLPVVWVDVGMFVAHF